LPGSNTRASSVIYTDVLTQSEGGTLHIAMLVRVDRRIF